MGMRHRYGLFVSFAKAEHDFPTLVDKKTSGEDFNVRPFQFSRVTLQGPSMHMYKTGCSTCKVLRLVAHWDAGSAMCNPVGSSLESAQSRGPQTGSGQTAVLSCIVMPSTPSSCLFALAVCHFIWAHGRWKIGSLKHLTTMSNTHTLTHARAHTDKHTRRVATYKCTSWFQIETFWKQSVWILTGCVNVCSGLHNNRF